MKELALYIEDQIKAGNWLFNLGIRGDMYNGLASATPGGASPGRFLQHQADEYGAARLLCADAGDAVQREPCAFQPGLRE